VSGLRVSGLTVSAPSGRRLVDDVSFSLGAGEILGLVGESGSGKTLTGRALMRLMPDPSLRIMAGAAHLGGRDVLALPEAAFRAVRGREIGMIFQNPGSHLDPVRQIGAQIAETIMLHEGAGRHAAQAAAVDLLRQVGVPDPARRARGYAHEFSGGMRQRAMIALALACNPAVLIADEPTTALDVTVQAQILRLLKQLQDDLGLAYLFITHNISVVEYIAHYVVVMYEGRIVEQGKVDDVLYNPQHPYTRQLLSAVPRIKTA